MFVHKFCDIYWVVSQLSIYEMLVACILMYFFESPWIMIILDNTEYL